MEPGAELLRVDGLSSPRRFQDISFSVRAGEVVGIAGLVGAGRSDIAQAIFGLDPEARGRVEVAGRRSRLGSPAAAMRAGPRLRPGGSQAAGAGAVPARAREPDAADACAALARFGWIRAGSERALADDAFARLRRARPRTSTS